MSVLKRENSSEQDIDTEREPHSRPVGGATAPFCCSLTVKNTHNEDDDKEADEAEENDC